MGKCEQCGNDYDKTFDVIAGGQTHTFDSFECAIQMLAPVAAFADAASSVTAWKRTASSIAAPIAPAWRG